MLNPNEIVRPDNTFWSDFTIADHFGPAAVKDTFRRAFKEWKSDYRMLTELIIVLNHKIWFWYGKDDAIALEYDRLWRRADKYALENLSNSNLEYYLAVTD